ncbi:hypothetical protein T552_01974 [Pneumocystis carinii B80]|uniref:MIT domain-containing protein n=1 Tax=Pneumocystis carinii (strain B80) TaxID=1408658 RepID=A0A0W4ZID9_PNEC8|nr:hypothetical protein T552_01974 [Pneumocystis carinii B80]KTW28113.1 hypothetical protein T552_01974 [Pneumocystis carinii B80]
MDSSNLEEHLKATLTDAFNKAQTAVLLDSSNNINDAIHAYTQACSLLKEVIVQLPEGKYQERLQVTYRAYLERVHLLDGLNQSDLDDADEAIFADAQTSASSPTGFFPESPHCESHDNVDSCTSDLSKKSFTMNYIKQISFSDINLLSPIKYLLKPIKEIISPPVPFLESPDQIGSVIPLNSKGSLELVKNADNIEADDTIMEENKSVSSGKVSIENDSELVSKQIFSLNNTFANWSPLLNDSPTFSHVDNSKKPVFPYDSTDSLIFEETHIAPFLRVYSDHKLQKENQHDDIFEKDTSNEKKDTFMYQNDQSFSETKKKLYSLYNNSCVSFNYFDKLSTNFSDTLTNSSAQISTATLIPSSSSNKTRHSDTYISFLHDNILPKTSLLEVDPIHMQKPRNPIEKTYWLMKILQKLLMPFIIKSEGSYITPQLFIPKDIWYVKNVKLKGEEEKIKVCESLIFTLNKIKSLKKDDLQSLIKELVYLDNMVDIFRFWLLKKFGTEVVNPKKRYGIIKFISKSKFLIKTPPPDQFNTHKFGIVQFDGPRKSYLTSIYRLFGSAQIIGQVLNIFDFHELPLKARDSIHQILINISDFFENVICHFVLMDINVLLDHFIKQFLYGNDYNTIISTY